MTFTGKFVLLLSLLACPQVGAWAQGVAQAPSKISSRGNNCTHSSGGTFGSDVDGGIANLSSTETMIVHCPLNVGGWVLGSVYAHDRHSAQDVVCTVQFREVRLVSGAAQLLASEKAWAQTLGTGQVSGGAQWVSFGYSAFQVNQLGWSYVRCTIPPASSLGSSVLKGYHFFKVAD